MASVFKPKGSDKYVIVYRDSNRKRRWKVGTRDKAVTQRIANALVEKVALRKDGLVDPRDEAYAKHAAESLLSHVDAWRDELRSRGATRQHVKLHASRAMRVVALIKGAKLHQIEAPKPATKKGVEKAGTELRSFVEGARITDLTAENVQKGLDRLKQEGRSLQTANHHRNAVKSFAKWLHETGRSRLASGATWSGWRQFHAAVGRSSRRSIIGSVQARERASEARKSDTATYPEGLNGQDRNSFKWESRLRAFSSLVSRIVTAVRCRSRNSGLSSSLGMSLSDRKASSI
jgi:hypothetical protein